MTTIVWNRHDGQCTKFQFAETNKSTVGAIVLQKLNPFNNPSKSKSLQKSFEK